MTSCDQWKKFLSEIYWKNFFRNFKFCPNGGINLCQETAHLKFGIILLFGIRSRDRQSLASEPPKRVRCPYSTGSGSKPVTALGKLTPLYYTEIFSKSLWNHQNWPCCLPSASKGQKASKEAENGPSPLEAKIGKIAQIWADTSELKRQFLDVLCYSWKP